MNLKIFILILLTSQLMTANDEVWRDVASIKDQSQTNSNDQPLNQPKLTSLNSSINNVEESSIAKPSTLDIPKGFEDQFDKLNIDEHTKALIDAPVKSNTFYNHEPTSKPQIIRPNVSKPQHIVKPNLPIIKDEFEGWEIKSRKVYDYRNQILSPKVYKDEYGPNNQHLPKAIYQEDYSKYLFTAVLNDDIKTIDALLKKGADINAIDQRNGYTPMMYATQLDKQKALRYLINRGANVFKIADDGKSALHIAGEKGHIDIFSVLIDEGLDVTNKDNWGKTPYQYAAHFSPKFALLSAKQYTDFNKALTDLVDSGSIEAINYLIKQGARIDYQNDMGDTAIIIATRNSDINMVNLLISHNASVSIRNKQGFSALDIASLNNNQTLVDIFKTVIVSNELSMTPLTFHDEK